MQVDKKIIYIIILVVGIPLLIFVGKRDKNTQTEYGSMQETYLEDTEEVEIEDNVVYERKVLQTTRMPYGAIYRLQNDFNTYLIENKVYGEIFEIEAIEDFQDDITFRLVSQNHNYLAKYKKEQDLFIFSEAGWY